MASRKWALLIGINHYQGPSGSVNALYDLRGAVADVADMRSLLVNSFEFAPDHIMVLENGRATRAAIFDAIRDHLAAHAGQEDIVLFYFSGHGSHTWNKKTARHEGTLVAHDSRACENCDILGSELSEALRAIAARHVVVMLDCCHAGNLMLSRAAGRVRSLAPQRAGPAIYPAEAEKGISIRTAGAPFVLLAASGALEPARETFIGGSGYRGIFTYALMLATLRLFPAATYRDLMELLLERMRTLGAFQNPQLEGALADQTVFGHRELVSQPYLLAWPAENSVRLAGGAVMGVTAQSHYAVYAPGTKIFYGGAVPVAEVEVVRVNTADSEARIVSGGPIEPASRAVEISHHHQGSVVRVGLIGLHGLEFQLRSFNHLKLIDLESSLDQPCDIVATRQDSGIVIELPGFDIQACLKENSEEALRERFTEALLHWAQWLNLLRIDNPGSGLQVGLTVEGISRKNNGRGYVHLGPNSEVTYFIANQSRIPLYVSALAFSDDGSVSVVFPPSYGPRLLMPEESIPDRLSVRMRRGCISESDILKVFATVTPCDLRILEIAARNGPRALNPLEQALEQAAFGSRPLERPTCTDWTTCQVTLELHKAV